MTAKKPHEQLRTNLAKRSTKAMVESGRPVRKLSDAEKKTPSEKNSKNARLRELKRSGRHQESCRKAAVDVIVFDCHTCSKYPCGTDPMACDEIMILERCGGCGLPVRHYRDVKSPWVKCLSCRGKV